MPRIILPQPFLVVPPDGSDPVHIHEADPVPPVLAVTLVTPYVAQKWLHAGDPVYQPVVVHDEDFQLVAGRAVLEMATTNPQAKTPAAVVTIGKEQADTAWTAVAAMRRAFSLPECIDTDGLVLDHDGGRVLAGAGALYDLRKPAVMVVLLVSPNADGRFN
jgi:hypothetical protein